MSQTDAASPPLRGDEARRAARNAAAIAAARVISSGAAFAWQLVLGRLLGDAAFGVYGTISGLIGIAVPLAAFGISPILIRDVARRPDLAGRCQSIALFTQTLLALLAYLALNGAGLALGYDEALRAFAAVAAFSLFVDLPGNLCYDLLLAQEKMTTTSAVEIAHIVARVALGTLLLSAGWGLAGAYIATLITGVVRSAALWWLLRRTGVAPVFPLDRRLARSLLTDSAPLAAASVLNMSYAYIDRLLTTSLLTTAAAGHLTAAFVVIYGVIDLLSTTVITALYPLMSRAYTPGGDNATFDVVVRTLARFTLLIGLPLGLVFTVHAGAITVPLFGDDFAPSADVLRVLIWFAVVAMIGNVYAQALLAQNRQRITVMARALALAVKLALSLMLLPAVGVVGAALASVGAELLTLALLWRAFSVHARTAARPSVGGAARPAGAARLAGAALLALGAMWALESRGVSPLVGMMAGGAVYGAGVLALRVLQAEEWDLLYRLAAALPGGALIRRFWRRDVPITW
jgi:PST family polysaccharide transporter